MTEQLAPGVVVSRQAELFTSTRDGIRAQHCFSFADHYDPTNIAVGPLQVCNIEQLDPMKGYQPHHHAHHDIVTIVLEGKLRHEDTYGNVGELSAGDVQLLQSADGVEHSETNPDLEAICTFVQLWFAADSSSTDVTYWTAPIGSQSGLHDLPLPDLTCGVLLQEYTGTSTQSLVIDGGAFILALEPGLRIDLGDGVTVELDTFDSLRLRGEFSVSLTSDGQATRAVLGVFSEETMRPFDPPSRS